MYYVTYLGGVNFANLKCQGVEMCTLSIAL